MADKFFSLPGGVTGRLKDMGDGTFAMVVTGDGSAASITRAGTILGQQTLSNAQLASAVAPPSPPELTKSVWVSVEGQNVRFRYDGATTAPTSSSGFLLIAGQPAYEIPGGAAQMENWRFIRVADGATVNLLYIG